MSSSSLNVRHWNGRIETLSPAELRKLQEARLRSLLERVQAKNPFYQAHFRRHGVDASRIRSLEEFSEKIPFVTKKDLIDDQAASPPYGTRMAAPQDEIAAVVLTSGTSGRGREVHCYTFADLERSTAQFDYLLHWQGIDPGERFFHTIPVGLELGGVWYKRGAERHGLNYFNVAKYDTDTRIDYMLRFAPHLLMTSVAYLNRLTVVCRERDMWPREAFPDLKAISIGGEAHGVEWAREMEEVWGAKLHERFGSTQSGGTHMFTCEAGVHDGDARSMLHNLGHKAIAEVIDPETGKHVGPGEEGELVVTCLYMESFPSVRFRMGDRVRYLPHTHCRCGRPFDGVECGTAARFDDMIKIKGYNIWPDAVDAVILAPGDVAEYAARVFIDHRGRETVEVRVEFAGSTPLGSDWRAALLGRFREELKRRTGVTMELVETASGSVPRFEMKARRWTDERPRGMQAKGMQPKGMQAKTEAAQ